MPAPQYSDWPNLFFSSRFFRIDHIYLHPYTRYWDPSNQSMHAWVKYCIIIIRLIHTQVTPTTFCIIHSSVPDFFTHTAVLATRRPLCVESEYPPPPPHNAQGVMVFHNLEYATFSCRPPCPPSPPLTSYLLVCFIFFPRRRILLLFSSVGYR